MRALSQVESLDESANAWVASDSLPPRAPGPIGVTLLSGNTLFVGGGNQLGVRWLPNAQIFDANARM